MSLSGTWPSGSPYCQWWADNRWNVNLSFGCQCFDIFITVLDPPYSLHQKKVHTWKLAKYSKAIGARKILGGLPYFLRSCTVPKKSPGISWKLEMRLGLLLGNSAGNMVHLMELILIPWILSTQSFFKCILSFGGDCICTVLAERLGIPDCAIMLYVGLYSTSHK